MPQYPLHQKRQNSNVHQSLGHQGDWYPRPLSPAPNFGKTCGIPKSLALAGSYGGAKGFSEIGRRGVKKRLVYLISLDCPILPVVGQEIFLLGIMEHSLHLKCLLMG